MNHRPPSSGLQHADFLVVGGGLAGATAAETLRAADPEKSVAILSAERLPPYYKPPLSKGYLTGSENEARLFIHPESFYRDQNIGLRLNARVLFVDPARRIVTTSTGEIGYGQLLIATGGAPNRLRVPGHKLPGVFYLGSKEDADAIRQAARDAKRAVVIGVSYLGMEIAMSLRKLGLDVTLVGRGALVLPYLNAPGLSAYFRNYAESAGVTVSLGDDVAGFYGDGKVEGLQLASGKRAPCDLAAVAIGISPATEFLAGSGIALEDGYVTVDEQLRASAPNVYAAGDVASFYDPVFGRRRQIQHWDNAVKQGRLAACNMLGRRMRYDELSYFYSDLGDISFAVLGAPEEADTWIGRGALGARSLAMFYLEKNVLRALFTMGRPAVETRSAEGLIRYRTKLSAVKEHLSDPDFPLSALPVQTALILQGGGALGAFECGVVKALEEEKIFPDIVAGVSIGAFNGAIIAANPRDATQALESFWGELSVASPAPSLPPAPFLWDERTAIAMNILFFGVPKFFKPRWLPPYRDPSGALKEWISFYDPSPIKALITKYVDFSALKSSPVRLLVGAVNVATAELEVFDSYVDDLSPDHLLASGSLPPGFPWTKVAGNAYWDGGIISNSPLDLLVGRACGPGAKHVFVVDLFRGERSLPTNIMEVLARRDEIIYAERIRSDLRHHEWISAYRGLVDDILARLAPDERAKVKEHPTYIQLMGDGGRPSIVRLVRPAHEGEQASRDYDFSDGAIRDHQKEGYMVAKRALGHE